MKTTVTLCTSLLLMAVLSTPCPAQGQERQRTFFLENEDLHSALDSLMLWYDVSIVYFDEHVSTMSVTSRCNSCPITEALSRILEGTGLTWIRMGSQFVLRQRPHAPAPVTTTVSGVVTDSLTGAWIAGATVLMQNDEDGDGRAAHRWCPTNAYGFYSLPDIDPGAYRLSVRAIGYTIARCTFTISGDVPVRCDLALRQMEITMQEFTVEGHRTESIPAGGYVRGTYIRSVPSDQTQYLLDGARIYNPSHFGGVLSTFQPDVLNDVDPAINGLSPFYGGRIGGLLDLSLREGTHERFSGNAGVGSLGAHLFVEGPAGDKSTFLVSGRRSFVEPMIPFLGNDDNPSRSGSYEIVGKANYRLAENSRLFLSGYLGGDSYANSVDGGGGHLDNSFNWSNGNLQCRWFGISSSSLFLFASAGYSRYDLTLDHAFSTPSTYPSPPTPSSGYRIEDLSLRAHAENFFDPAHTVRGGVEVVGHRISGNISEISLSNASLQLKESSFWELAVYAQDQWRITDELMVELGARATSFVGDFRVALRRRSPLLAHCCSGYHHALLHHVDRNQSVHPCVSEHRRILLLSDRVLVSLGY